MQEMLGEVPRPIAKLARSVMARCGGNASSALWIADDARHVYPEEESALGLPVLAALVSQRFEHLHRADAHADLTNELGELALAGGGVLSSEQIGLLTPPPEWPHRTPGHAAKSQSIVLAHLEALGLRSPV